MADVENIFMHRNSFGFFPKDGTCDRIILDPNLSTPSAVYVMIGRTVPYLNRRLAVQLIC
jgi:hypothetical protein